MFSGLKKKHGRQQTLRMLPFRVLVPRPFRVEGSILRMRSTADGRHNAAFTLLELVIVVAIIGLMAVMTVPGFMGMMRGRHLTSAATVIHAALNGAKNVAVTQRRPYGLVFDISAGSMGVYEDGDTSNPLQGKVIFLAQVVSFDTADSAWNVPDNKVIFRPDGSVDSSTSPVIVVVNRQGEHMYIRVVRNTGQVVIE